MSTYTAKSGFEISSKVLRAGEVARSCGRSLRASWMASGIVDTYRNGIYDDRRNGI
jgi:predicted Rdx family selenoprotein